MKINTKVRYGLRVMIDLAENQGNESFLQKDIAARLEIPLKYLDTIIAGLRNSGLLINVAGKGSGYRLSKKPSDISVYDVYRAFEPELTLVNCLCDASECKRMNSCPARDYWYEMNIKIKSLMQETNLMQLV